MYAIKGTTAAMQCRGYQYELGKTYKMDKEPILCEQGFHACLNPYWVEFFYKDNGFNRYFLVDLGGTITDCDIYDTKVAANEITFLKEVTVNDFPALFKEFIKDKERLAKLKYYEGFALIKKDCKWNHIGHDGNYLYDEWFDDVYNFSEGFARVKKGNKYNFIDQEGEFVSEDWFDYAYSFSEGFAQVEKDRKYNFINKDGNYLSKDWLVDANPFDHGFAKVKKCRKWYKLYPDGHLVLD